MTTLNLTSKEKIILMIFSNAITSKKSPLYNWRKIYRAYAGCPEYNSLKEHAAESKEKTILEYIEHFGSMDDLLQITRNEFPFENRCLNNFESVQFPENFSIKVFKREFNSVVKGKRKTTVDNIMNKIENNDKLFYCLFGIKKSYMINV